MRLIRCGFFSPTAPFRRRVAARRHFIHTRATSFRMSFDRGDLPIRMEYLTGCERIAWTVDVDKLDYTLYLPLFFDGKPATLGK